MMLNVDEPYSLRLCLPASSNFHKTHLHLTLHKKDKGKNPMTLTKDINQNLNQKTPPLKHLEKAHFILK